MNTTVSTSIFLTKSLKLWQIIGLWGVTAAPMVVLAWFIAPIVVDWVSLPAVITYWIVLMVGMAWQTAVSLWIIWHEEGSLHWKAICGCTWFNGPRDPKTGKPRARLLWRSLPYWPIVVISLTIGALTPVWLLLLRRFGFDYFIVPLLHWPAYANITELASPELADLWWIVFAAMLGWTWSALFAQEFLFRGVLLPRMAGVFGKRDWIANALLYALWHLFQYWMIPFRLIEGLIIARAARRYTSNWMTVAIRSVEGLAVLTLVVLGLTSRPLTTSTTPITFPYISHQPSPSVLFRGQLTAIPEFDSNSGAPFQVDLRRADLSALDLRNALDNLVYADFDTRTMWPAPDLLPRGFDPARILDLGKNPGLGIRSLHAQGITGQGVGVAIIDQPLLTDHKEYADRLLWYEEIDVIFTSQAQMHGPAVASLAVGRTVGVAPEADLYYIEAGNGLSSLVLYSHDYAQAIRHILQINEQLPAERKIRVISISNGWLPWVAGYNDVVSAVQEAEATGMLVVNVGYATGLPENIALYGLGRLPATNPDKFESYQPGIFWAREFYTGQAINRFLLPMDSRTMASDAGVEDYMFNRVGGGSWVPPYIAGLYALAAQIEPAITPGHFWSIALHTARAVEVVYEGHTYQLGTIFDPDAFISELRRK